MASAIFPRFKEALLERELSGAISGLNLKVMLIDTGTYTYDANDHYHSDIASGIVATSGNLTSVTVSTTGTLDSADITITSVSGATVEAVIFYVDTGVSGTSHLISFIDGLSLTPDGGNVDVTINSIAIL
jgi:hypothetical protein